MGEGKRSNADRHQPLTAFLWMPRPLVRPQESQLALPSRNLRGRTTKLTCRAACKGVVSRETGMAARSGAAPGSASMLFRGTLRLAETQQRFFRKLPTIFGEPKCFRSTGINVVRKKRNHDSFFRRA